MSAAPMFDVAERMILAPSGLDESRLSSVLGTVMTRGIDYADLYFQLSREESWSLEDGIVKEGSHSIEQGVGVRAISGEKTGFAYTDEVILPALVKSNHVATEPGLVERRLLDLGHRLLVGRAVHAPQRPRHLRAHDLRPFGLERRRNAAVEGARPHALAVEEDDTHAAQARRRMRLLDLPLRMRFERS